MEAIAVIGVIIVIAIILGVKPIVLVAAAGIAVGLILLLMIVLFLFFFTRLITSHKAEAEFTRIDIKPNGRFKVAFYNINGEEYPNVFPEEGFLEDKLYKKERKYRVFLNKKGYVFDRFAVATCIIGFSISLLILSAAVTAAVILMR